METIYYRKCANCGRGMNEGYVIYDETYCSDECRASAISDTDYEANYADEDNDDDNVFCYWTEWDEADEGEPIYNAEGDLMKGVE